MAAKRIGISPAARRSGLNSVIKTWYTAEVKSAAR